MFNVYDIDGTFIGGIDGHNIYSLNSLIAHIQEFPPAYGNHKVFHVNGWYAGGIPQEISTLRNGKQAARIRYKGNADPTWLDTDGDFWRPVESQHSRSYFRKIGYLRSSNGNLATIQREDLDKVVGAA